MGSVTKETRVSRWTRTSHCYVDATLAVLTWML